MDKLALTRWKKEFLKAPMSSLGKKIKDTGLTGKHWEKLVAAAEKDGAAVKGTRKFVQKTGPDFKDLTVREAGEGPGIFGRMIRDKRLPGRRDLAHGIENMAGQASQAATIPNRGSINIVTAKGLPKDKKTLFMHHELAEARGIAARSKKEGGYKKLRSKGLISHPTIKDSDMQGIRTHLPDPRYTVKTPKGHYTLAQTSHVSPKVLAEESRDVLYAPKKLQTELAGMRDTTGETAAMRRLGIDYGQSWTPKGSKKFVKKWDRAAKLTDKHKERTPNFEKVEKVHKFLMDPGMKDWKKNLIAGGSVVGLTGVGANSAYKSRKRKKRVPNPRY